MLNAASFATRQACCTNPVISFVDSISWAALRLAAIMRAFPLDEDHDNSGRPRFRPRPAVFAPGPVQVAGSDSLRVLFPLANPAPTSDNGSRTFLKTVYRYSRADL